MYVCEERWRVNGADIALPSPNLFFLCNTLRYCYRKEDVPLTTDIWHKEEIP